jgi:hypothetical protein
MSRTKRNNVSVNTEKKLKPPPAHPVGNKRAVGNRGGGRKTDYKGEESCRIASSMAKLGATDKQIAAALGISTSTLHQWRVTHAEFSECLMMAKEVVDAAVERALIQRALGYDYEINELSMGKKIVVRKHALPDVRAQQFWLRNRMPDIYRERKETEPKHTLSASMDRMLDIIEEEIKLDRANKAKLLDHQPEPAS